MNCLQVRNACPARVSPPRHVVEIEHPFYLERNMPHSLDKSQIAARIVDPRQIDQLAFIQNGLA